MSTNQTYKQEKEQLQKEAPTLFALPRMSVFVVPEMYFDLLREEWALRSASTLDKSESTSSFQIPEGYFESARADLIQRISDTPENISIETKNDSALKTPEGYFGQLSEDIFAQTSRASELKEVPVRKLYSTKRFYWLAASAAVLILAVTTFLAQSAEDECITFACLLENTELTEKELIDIYSEDSFESEWTYDGMTEIDILTEDEVHHYLEDDLDWVIENEYN
jgi:hypothetical protein